MESPNGETLFLQKELGFLGSCIGGFSFLGLWGKILTLDQ